MNAATPGVTAIVVGLLVLIAAGLILWFWSAVTTPPTPPETRPAPAEIPVNGSWRWVPADADDTRPIARGQTTYAAPLRVGPYVPGRHATPGGGR